MHNSDIREEYAQQFGKVKDSFYRVLSYVEGRPIDNDSRPSGKAIKGRLGQLESCYFCGTGKGLLQHHISYYPQVLCSLCGKCHSKIHEVQEEYHKAGVEKDKQIKRLNAALNTISSVCHQNSEHNDEKKVQ
jgi:hypothetical protein